MTDQQREQLERCRKTLGPCIEDRTAILADFLEQLGYPEPEMVGEDAARFVPGMSEWIDAQTIQPEDRGFLILRLAILIGEVVAQRTDGGWFLDDDPTSPNFANFVVGPLERSSAPNSVVNPFSVAVDFLKEREGVGPIQVPTKAATNYVTGNGRVVRTLKAVVAEIEARNTGR